MKNILFVCHGNICRSPMAEFIFKNMLAQRGLSASFTVASAATSTEEIYNGRGNPVYPPAVRELAKHGISAAGKTAVQLQKSDYAKYDLLVGMDSANIRNMSRICGGDPDGKIHLLLSYTDHCADVADPWYTGDFETTWRDVQAGCRALLAQLDQK